MIRERREPEHARAYVMRCMRNRLIDLRRSRAGRQRTTDGVAFLDTDSDDLLERERVERIRMALSGLSDAQREVIVLKTYCDMTFGEIAEVLDQPPGTTASHYRRGIERLRDIYRREVDHVT
ncbi:MAG: sigma-70 family RNA polymerase sigma factor [Planctomycetes bacterium]|nr:sigma-70 family RNA polymerase sigma factor [Planctomycetota bacterium]